MFDIFCLSGPRPCLQIYKLSEIFWMSYYNILGNELKYFEWRGLSHKFNVDLVPYFSLGVRVSESKSDYLFKRLDKFHLVMGVLRF